MAHYRILPAALAAVLAFGVLPALAQDSAAPAAADAAAAGVKAPRAKPAMIRLDFGAGRKVEVNCGDSALAACVETIAPLVDKVASTPAEHGRDHRGGKGWGEKGRGDKGPGGKGHPGKDHPPKPGDQPPPPPPAE